MKLLTRFLIFAAMLTLTGRLQAQITISENFEGPTFPFPPNGWTDGPGHFSDASAFPCSNTTSASANAFAYCNTVLPCSGHGGAYAYAFFLNPTMGINSPVGTSNGQDLTISFDYKIVNSYDETTGTPNSPNWGDITVLVSIDGGNTYPITAGVINPSNHVVSATCVTRVFIVSGTLIPNGSAVKVRWLANWGGSNLTESFYYLDNISITQASLVPPSCVTAPSPANAAISVLVGSTLSWSLAPGATAYDVYLGTTAMPTFVGTVTDASYQPVGLTANTLYYWQVIPKNLHGSATGCPVWSFTTAPPPPGCATGFTPAVSPVTLLCSPNLSSANFTWVAPTSGTVPTGYKFYLAAGSPRWQGTPVNTNFTIYDLLPNTTYNWYVVPTNANGDAIGCNTPVSFTTGDEPPCVVNNSCATATMIGAAGMGGAVNSTTIGATISQLPEPCSFSTKGNADDDVWFSFITDTDGGDVTIALTEAPSTLDAVVQVYSGSCGNLTNIGCADNYNSPGIESITIYLTALVANTTYFVRVYGYYTATYTSGNFMISTYGTGLSSSLPLELASFTGQAGATTNTLHWETLTEKNVQFHIVERSMDGLDWREIGRKNGLLNSTVPTKYTLEDHSPVAKAYYRLRSVDFDGQESTSNSILLVRKGEYFGITSVFPSPTRDNVTVQFNAIQEETVTIQILDMTGRLVLSKTMEAAKDINQMPLILHDLQAGVYSVTIINSTGVSAPIRFVKD